jgi:hypothetical protein
MPVTVADVEACARADGAAQHRHTIASQNAGDHNFDRMNKHLRRAQNDPLYIVNAGWRT